MGIGLAALAGFGGDLLNGAINDLYHWENNGWRSDYQVATDLRDYDKNIADYFLDKQMAYNKDMASTAYQRAMADMQAAGLNPASMAGVSAQAASSPGVSASYKPGGSYSSAAHNYTNNFLEASFVNSAVNAAIAKDKNIASKLASEIVDNARHAHAMEEIEEAKSLKSAKAEPTGSKWLDNWQSKFK